MFEELKNIYDSGELNEESTYSILEYMGNDGKQKYQTRFYNLDAILSVGYRVNSKNATRFRVWANKILKGYYAKDHLKLSICTQPNSALLPGCNFAPTIR